MKPQIENLGKVSITVDKDPYDASKAYPKLTIVYIEGDYRTYISRKPVLPNTSILDKEFWIPFSSLSEQLLINYNGFKELVLQELATQNVTIRRIDDALTQFINTDITNLVLQAIAQLAIVIDSNYVHTDNNYTTTEKSKLASLPTSSELDAEFVSVRSLFDSYYNKTQINELLDVIRNTFNSYYNKTQIDSLLSSITSEFANYYTKSNLYTKTEVDAKVKVVQDALNTLIGTDDVTEAIDTFNEIQSFLEDYDTTSGGLKDIIDALETSVKTWANSTFTKSSELYNNIYNKTEIDDKISTINTKFGDYLLSTEIANTYLSKADAQTIYQPKGDYALNAALNYGFSALSNTINQLRQSLAKQTYLPYITIYPEDCYFTYIALGNGTCHLANSDYYYSKDLGATWNHITSSSTEINVVKGNVVLFKGTIMPQAYAGIGRFYSSVAYEIAGNPMSFIYGDDFRGKINWPSNMPESSGFHTMFYDETNLRSAKHLILTASSVLYQAYSAMFTNCSNLVAGPIIAAETVLDRGCDGMFYGCAKLSYINTRFRTTSSNNPLAQWVYHVASKGIFIKNVNATWTYTGDSGVPDGWTVYYDYQH